ncbi:MAG TPA: hypothetical protein VL463_19665 [Kofleriaceae bacterium]|nr:hypothetical protein [Kofleriaceae bacterium]
MRALLFVIVAGCGAAASSAPPPVIAADAAALPVRVPFGVADDAGRLFITRVDGHIDALDARTGARLWISPDAATPLVGVDGGVIALVVQRVAFFDRAGQRMWWSDRIPLGPHPWSLMDPVSVEHGTLHATLSMTGGGGGMSECMEFDVGAADIDLRTGHVATTFVPSLPPPGPCRAQPPATITLDGAPLVLTAEVSDAAMRTGPDGRMWMDRHLVATRDEQIIWMHELPPDDVTPYE